MERNCTSSLAFREATEAAVRAPGWCTSLQLTIEEGGAAGAELAAGGVGRSLTRQAHPQERRPGPHVQKQTVLLLIQPWSPVLVTT